MALGEAIRALRRERGLTQSELGLKADIHPTWISQIEMGKVNPTFLNVLRICRGLEVRPSDLAYTAEELEL
jgi:XRE family transcriptional regulator, regulator of sulfur utilization